jgi:hypothetical protein
MITATLFVLIVALVTAVCWGFYWRGEAFEEQKHKDHAWECWKRAVEERDKYAANIRRTRNAIAEGDKAFEEEDGEFRMNEQLNVGDIVMWTPKGKRPYICAVARIATVESGLKPLVEDSVRGRYPELSDKDWEELKQTEWYEAGHPNAELGSEGIGMVFNWYLMQKSEDLKSTILWREDPCEEQ